MGVYQSWLAIPSAEEPNTETHQSMTALTSHRLRLFSLALASFFLSFFGGCSESEDSSEQDAVVNEIAIQFTVTVDGSPFSCGEVFREIGSSSAEMAFTDMRMYVHDLILIDSSGREYPVTLAEDGIWQRDGVALLDFEDGCENGTQQTNTVVRGEVAAKEFRGVRFSVGLPPELNSSETVLEGRGSPLNQTAMFWSWKSGYKYVRLDGDSGPFRLHLGASGCGDEFDCAELNIPSVTLAAFNPDIDSIQLDLGHLLQGTDVSQNSPSTAPGCMGESSDPDCQDIFERIGLGAEGADLAWSAVPSSTRGI